MHEEVLQEEVVTEAIEIQTDTSVIMSVSCELETKGDLELTNIGSHIPESSCEDTSINTDEPITIQTTHDVPTEDEMQNLGSSTSTPPSKRGRFSKPKPNVGQGLRTRRAPQQQAPQEPLQSSTGRNSTEPMEEDSGPMEESSTILAQVMQPDTSSEQKDCPDIMHEKLMEEDSRSVPSLKRKYDNVITEQNVKKDKQELKETEPETEQLNRY